MVKNKKAGKGKYTTSDHLGIALACLAGAMTIVLFFVEKTPTTIVVLLAAMVGLCVFPVWHFLRKRLGRAVGLIVVVLAAVALGWQAWPRHAPIIAETSRPIPPAVNTSSPQVASQPVPMSPLPQITPKTPRTLRLPTQAAQKTPVNEPVNQVAPKPVVDFSAPSNELHVERSFIRGGTDLSRCVNCSIEDSQTGNVEAGPSTVIKHNWINGNVRCEKGQKCDTVDVKDNRAQNSALENTGTIGEAEVYGNVIRASQGGGNATGVKNNSGGEIQKLSEHDNDIGSSGQSISQPAGPQSHLVQYLKKPSPISMIDNSGTNPNSKVFLEGNQVINENGDAALVKNNADGSLGDVVARGNQVIAGVGLLPPAHALHGSNAAVADQLSACIDNGHKLMDSFLRDDNTQVLREGETAWQKETHAIVLANLGEPYASLFLQAHWSNHAIPPGHDTAGGVIFNLVDAKLRALSSLVEDLIENGN